jgi:hypothetical protein
LLSRTWNLVSVLKEVYSLRLPENRVPRKLSGLREVNMTRNEDTVSSIQRSALSNSKEHRPVVTCWPRGALLILWAFWYLPKRCKVAASLFEAWSWNQCYFFRGLGLPSHDCGPKSLNRSFTVASRAWRCDEWCYEQDRQHVPDWMKMGKYRREVWRKDGWATTKSGESRRSRLSCSGYGVFVAICELGDELLGTVKRRDTWPSVAASWSQLFGVHRSGDWLWFH